MVSALSLRLKGTEESAKQAEQERERFRTAFAGLRTSLEELQEKIRSSKEARAGAWRLIERQKSYADRLKEENERLRARLAEFLATRTAAE